MDTRGRSCSWAGRTHEVKQRGGSVLPPNIGYVQWFEIEIFTMSTTWTFLCNFENLSKVALWVSFEPYRSVSMCLLFSQWSICSAGLTYFILFHQIMMKKWWTKTHALLHFETTYTFMHMSFFFLVLFSSEAWISLQHNNQSPPSILTFSNLEKAASPVRSRHKW